MKIFKEIIMTVIRISVIALGYSMQLMLNKNYEPASWILMITSFLYIIGYLTERWSST